MPKGLSSSRPSRKDGTVQSIEIVAEVGGTLRLENLFGDRYVVTGVEASDVKTQDANLLVDLQPGQKVTFIRR